jgi:D-inositol-3-phosphate glycosyltransferase
MKEKIVLISPAHPLRGGIATSSERLAHELIAMGHEVVIFSFSLQYPNFLFPGKTQYTDAPAPAQLHINSTINSINPISWVRTAFLINRLKPSRIITRYWLPFMGPCLGTILLIIRVLAGKKLTRAALVDNLIPHEKRMGDRFFSRFFAWNNEAFVAMSTTVSQDIKALVPKKQISVSPHPIYDNYGEPVPRKEALAYLDLDPDAHWLLFFGFIRAYKGLDLLLEAMHHIPLKDLNIKLLVAGECYENWQPYQNLIDQTDAKDRIVLRTDFISDAEVRYYFSAAQLVVQPYKSATQSGITQIAMHFNKPSLVTRVGGLPDMVIDGATGYVVEPEPRAIAEAVTRHFPKGTPKDMSKQIEEEKQKFSWRKLADALLA